MIRRSTVVLLFLLLAHAGVLASYAKPPRVFLLDGGELQKLKDAKATDATLKAWLAEIDKKATKALKVEIGYVVTKTGLPPSGDKHDYMSQAPYFWRNPDTATGLPYVRRDGERNPEIKNFPDHDQMDKMVVTVEQLALGHYLTGDERYAARAAEILRAWFLQPATKMKPNLEYAQAVPGQNTGRGTGIIESRGLTRVVDAVGLLQGSKAWSDKDQKDIQDWFSSYLDWLIGSKNGKAESNAKNNHGTFYDVQVAGFALFVGRKELAKSTIEAAKKKRIDEQVTPDGKQPLELERTKAMSYSTMNLDGLLSLAKLGESVDVDLWEYKSSDGRSIRRAIEFFFPFTGGEKWPYKQIEPFDNESFYRLMRRAARKYKDAAFQKMMSTVPAGGSIAR
jgi:hypothetical protein